MKKNNDFIHIDTPILEKDFNLKECRIDISNKD